MRAQHWRALSLVQYLDLIYRAHVNYLGHAWLLYDELFRMRAVIHPNLCWDEPHPGLWLQYITTTQPRMGDRFDSGHLICKANLNFPPRVPSAQTPQPRWLCWEFNSQGDCARKACKFRHQCTLCGGHHASINCFRAHAQKGGKEAGANRKPDGGRTAAKGAQAN